MSATIAAPGTAYRADAGAANTKATAGSASTATANTAAFGAALAVAVEQRTTATPATVAEPVVPVAANAAPATESTGGSIDAAADNTLPAVPANTPVPGNTPLSGDIPAPGTGFGDAGQDSAGQDSAGQETTGAPLSLAAAFGWPAAQAPGPLANSVHSRQPGPISRRMDGSTGPSAAGVPSTLPADPLGAVDPVDPASGAPVSAGATDGGATDGGATVGGATAGGVLPLAQALPSTAVAHGFALHSPGSTGGRPHLSTQPVPPSAPAATAPAASAPVATSPALPDATTPAVSMVPAASSSGTVAPSDSASTGAGVSAAGLPAVLVQPIAAAGATQGGKNAADPAAPAAAVAATDAAVPAANPNGAGVVLTSAVVVPGAGVPAPSGSAALAPAQQPAQQPGQPQAAPAPPLTSQLSAPLTSLAGARPGEHLITVRVTPEDLGPVTVRAHISATEVRIDLVSPTDAGREALRAVLTDLKRDLAATGLTANLNLSSGGQPDGGSRDSGRNLFQDPAQPRRPAPSHHAAPPVLAQPTAPRAARGLDVIA